MKKIKDNHNFGLLLSILGILTSLLLLFLLADMYMPVVEGKILEGRPDEGITVRIVYALLGWVGMSAGALWAVVLVGFVERRPWAWTWGVVASTAQILAGFFPMIPAASIDLPTPTVWIFGLGFLLWFGMLFIGGVRGRIITLVFFSGIAYVLTFIDGVGAISRYQTVSEPFAVGMYAMGQMVNWWGAAAWAAFIAAAVKGKPWSIPVGIFAASMSIFGGLPVGITDVLRLSRFSMFLPAPLVSAVLLIILLLPGTRQLLEGEITPG